MGQSHNWIRKGLKLFSITYTLDTKNIIKGPGCPFSLAEEINYLESWMWDSLLSFPVPCHWGNTLTSGPWACGIIEKTHVRGESWKSLENYPNTLWAVFLMVNKGPCGTVHFPEMSIHPASNRIKNDLVQKVEEPKIGLECPRLTPLLINYISNFSPANDHVLI